MSQIKPAVWALGVAMKTQHAPADICLDCNAGQTLLTQKIMLLFMRCLCLSRYCFCLLCQMSVALLCSLTSRAVTVVQL